MSELPDGRLKITRGFRLQWEEAQQTHVLLYPEGMVTLNESSSEILYLCDGTMNSADIIATLEQKYPTADLAADVRDFLTVAYQNGWLQSAV